MQWSSQRHEQQQQEQQEEEGTAAQKQRPAALTADALRKNNNDQKHNNEALINSYEQLVALSQEQRKQQQPQKQQKQQKQHHQQQHSLAAMPDIVALATGNKSRSSNSSSSNSSNCSNICASSPASPRAHTSAVSSIPQQQQKAEEQQCVAADQTLQRLQFMPSSSTEQQQFVVQQHQQYRHAAVAVGISASSNNYQNVGAHIGQSRQSNSSSAALEQYRLQQLYNYALSIERLRCPPSSYSAAAAMAAAASYANSGGSGAYAAANSAANYAAAGAVACGGGGGSQRLALSMSLFPQRIFQPEEPKPQHSYIGLIAMAILSAADCKLVLSDIYQYILDNYAYFRARGPGWRNSIRHNLSLNDCFIKSGRSANGKGHYWAIHPANMDDFRKGDFRRRKAQRKVRKHMGLSVDDAGTDSPSPPPLDLSATPPPATVAANVLPTHHPPHALAAAHQLAAAAAAAHTHAATFGYLLQHQQQHASLSAFQQHQQQQAPFMAAAASLPPHYATQLMATATCQRQQPYALLSQPHAFIAAQQPMSAYINEQQNSGSHQQHGSVDDTNSNQATATTAAAASTVIANLYTQTRKRQFDVASLLAPDVKLDIVNDLQATTTTTTTTLQQHTFITKVSVQHQQHQQQQLQRQLLLELADEQEDIVDVEQLLSDDDLLEEDCGELAEQRQQHEDALYERQLAKADKRDQHPCCLMAAEATRRLSLDACANKSSSGCDGGNSNSRQQTIQSLTGVNNNAAAIATNVSPYEQRTLSSSSDSTNNGNSQTDTYSKGIAPIARDAGATTATPLKQLEQQQLLELRPSRSPSPSNNSSAHEANSNNSCSYRQHHAQPPACHSQRSKHGTPSPAAPQPPSPLSASVATRLDPQQIFGCYYGTYMAAAAARRIGSHRLDSPVLQPPQQQQ